MIAIFELGTLWFWLLICVISIVLMAVQENAKSPGSWSTFWVVVTFAALYWCGAGGTLRGVGMHIYHYPFETIAYFLMYTLVGTIWSFWKWKEIVDSCAEKYSKALRVYREYKEKFPQGGTDSPHIEDHKPLAKDYAGELFNWIFYWPFSMTWFVIHEPIERLFRFIMERTKKVYEGIANRAFDKVQPTKSDDLVHK